MDIQALIQSVGLPIAILGIVGTVFLKMVEKLQTEHSEIQKWVRDSLTGLITECKMELALGNDSRKRLLEHFEFLEGKKKE